MEYTKKQIEMIKKELNPIDREKLYDDMLDEVFGTVSIAGLDYSVSNAQKEIDPTAYRCGVNDYIDSLLDDTLTEIDDEYYYTDEIEKLDLEDDLE